jgi:hypothetical protein
MCAMANVVPRASAMLRARMSLSGKEHKELARDLFGAWSAQQQLSPEMREKEYAPFSEDFAILAQTRPMAAHVFCNIFLTQAVDSLVKLSIPFLQYIDDLGRTDARFREMADLLWYNLNASKAELPEGFNHLDCFRWMIARWRPLLLKEYQK